MPNCVACDQMAPLGVNLSGPSLSAKINMYHKNTCYWDIQGCHLSSTSKLPDFSLIFSLIFYSFPYPLTDKKIVFILNFNGANCITINLGLLSQERICSPLPMGANSFFSE